MITQLTTLLCVTLGGDQVVRDQFVLEMVSQKDGIKSMLSSGSQSFECNGHFDFAELLTLRDDSATIIKVSIPCILPSWHLIMYLNVSVLFKCA